LHKYRTHTCSELTKKDAGKTVKLSGWIHRKRDHGNLLFFDLRDHYGLTQCVTENSSNFFKEIEKVKPESVVCVSGKIVKRSTDTINKEFIYWRNRNNRFIIRSTFCCKRFTNACFW